eukprot:TRINITY_DN47257_c0_g1_i1.p1 TRINITY_DN47257_c0_g1~~TRINITY_DN47257_c0_g1_i1.p1  ORF type:complete len:266 (+),score=28.11 TRINITY_DN47257_c0_g1_i1:123-920(+)
MAGDFHLGQSIVAADDLLFGDRIGITLGSPGLVVGATPARDGLLVRFDSRLDGDTGDVVVGPAQIMTDRPLLGDFRIGQKVQAILELHTAGTRAVGAGSPGVVLAEHNDTRLTVSFSVEDGGTRWLNVLPSEIIAVHPLPDDFPQGHEVETTLSLTMREGLMPTGTRGRVISGVNRAQVVVAFPVDGGLQAHMVVDLGAIRSAETGEFSSAAPKCPESHVLMPFAAMAPLRCRRCAEEAVCGLTLLGCRECGFDLCMDCVIHAAA